MGTKCGRDRESDFYRGRDLEIAPTERRKSHSRIVHIFIVEKGVLKMKMAVVSLIVLAVLSVNGVAQEYTRWGLPEGAKLRLGKGRVNRIAYSPDGARLAVAGSIGIWRMMLRPTKRSRCSLDTRLRSRELRLTPMAV